METFPHLPKYFIFYLMKLIATNESLMLATAAVQEYLQSCGCLIPNCCEQIVMSGLIYKTNMYSYVSVEHNRKLYSLLNNTIVDDLKRNRSCFSCGRPF